MKARHLAIALALGPTLATPLMAQQVLVGDTRSACEAVLCLASGTRPTECMPSLRRYFSISFKKWSDTLQGRVDFLNLCPASNVDAKMKSLVSAIANGAGSCDAAALNGNLMVWQSSGGEGGNGSYYISNAMPAVCTTYASHTYTDLKATAPLYVGDPARNGFWVDPSGYAQALQQYKARIAAEDAAAAAAQNSGGG